MHFYLQHDYICILEWIMNLVLEMHQQNYSAKS